MPALAERDLAAFVVAAAFLGETAVFACGDGRVHRGGDAMTAHRGLLAAIKEPAGETLLTAGDDGRVCRIATTGAPLLLAEKERRWIDQLAAGPNRAIAFAAGRTVWVREEGGREHSLTRPTAVLGLAFFPKGLRLALAGYHGVGLWFPGTQSPVQELAWKGAHIGVTLSPDGGSLVTAMQENALHGWRLKDGQHMRMTGYPEKVKSWSWSAKGRYLATAGAQAAILWPFHFKDGPMGKRPLELGAREATVKMVACHPREEVIALGYADGMILLVRFSDGEEVLLRRPGGGAITALAWDAGGQRLAFGSEAGAAGVIDLSA